MNALPPWPADAPAAFVGMEETAGACWRPRHYGSSEPTGNQTEGDKKQEVLIKTWKQGFSY